MDCEWIIWSWFSSFDKFVSFLITKDLVISYGGNCLTIGPTTSGKAKNVAYSDELNKLICLSDHYDVDGGNNGSSVYHNGQKWAMLMLTYTFLMRCPSLALRSWIDATISSIVSLLMMLSLGSWRQWMVQSLE